MLLVRKTPHVFCVVVFSFPFFSFFFLIVVMELFFLFHFFHSFFLLLLWRIFRGMFLNLWDFFVRSNNISVLFWVFLLFVFFSLFSSVSLFYLVVKDF